MTVLTWLVFAISFAVTFADSTRTQIFLPQYEVTDTTQVERGAITIPEIIRRCTEGESQKLKHHQDISYVAHVRSMMLWEKRKEIQETTFVAYEDAAGFSRLVVVDEVNTNLELKDGQWSPVDDNDESPVEVQVGGEGMEMFTNLPIFLEQVEDFKFELADRKLLDDRVIFRITFTPKSSFKPLPSGTVYVDTQEYQIIHEEYFFEGQNPFPLLIKNLKRFSRQWKQLDNGTWVTHRIAAEIEFRSMFGLIPGNASVAIQMEDYRFNQGYDAARFGER